MSTQLIFPAALLTVLGLPMLVVAQDDLRTDLERFSVERVDDIEIIRHLYHRHQTPPPEGKPRVTVTVTRQSYHRSQDGEPPSGQTVAPLPYASLPGGNYRWIPPAPANYQTANPTGVPLAGRAKDR